MKALKKIQQLKTALQLHGKCVSAFLDHILVSEKWENITITRENDDCKLKNWTQSDIIY